LTDSVHLLMPAEVIQFRAECYKLSDGAGVFSLYSVRSDLRKLFTAEAFSEHFSLLVKGNEHSGLKIVKETVKKNLAEVKFIEHISEESTMVTYYSKAVLTKEDGCWKIIKEMREHKKA